MQDSLKRRCLFLCGLLVVGLSFLSYRLVQIQIVDRKKFADRASSSYKRKSNITHVRGMILDRNDEVIACDITEKSVYIDKYHLLNIEVAAGSLASFYLRNSVGRQASELFEKALLPLVEKKSFQEIKSWSGLSARKRQSLRARGAKLLIENLDVMEIKKRNIDVIIEEYYRPLGVTKDELRKLTDLKSKKMHVRVRKGLDFKAARKLEELLKEHGVKGFDFQDHVRREYREPWMATHTIGVVNHERKGVVGIEGKLDSYLKGRDGSETRYLDARGYTIPGDQETLPPQHGRDVRLTIDMRIQSIIEEEIDKGMEFYQGERASIIVLDPHTGDILAMASRPHYNLNTREGMKDSGFNFAIQAQNETGSTIKIVALAAALNEGVCKYDTPIDCGWGVITGPGLKPPVRDHHPYGVLPFWKVLQKSSNTGTYRIGTMVEKTKYFEYLSALGYGKKTGIQLMGEAKGKASYRSNEREFASCTYGYMVSASPLQIATAYAVIANGGKYIPPRIIKDIHTKEGKVITGKDLDTPRPPVSEVLRPEVAEQMRAALKTVTETGGTATRAGVEGYLVGGKTGTNHRIVDGKYKNIDGEEEYLVSFAGICPIDEPDFVCVVVMDNPKKRTQIDEETKEIVPFKPYGGTIAGPMFAKIVKRIAPLRGIEPNFEAQAQR